MFFIIYYNYSLFIGDYYRAIDLTSRVFTNGTGDRSSISRLKKMALDASLLNTQHYKVRIKGKVEQSWERSSVLPYSLVL